MRSRADRGGLLLRFAFAALMCAASPALHAQVGQAAATAEPGPDDIRHALDGVKADPNLNTERTMKLLRWNETAPSSASGLPSWLRALLPWFRGLVSWLNESTRVLWWVTGAVLAAVLVVYVARLVRSREGTSLFAETFIAPTHVQDLDIRPETLPPDVGAAARALWDAGESRAALSLLYRGLLSRLAHVHRVPIRDSSTEGDCLALAAHSLTGRPLDYASRLVVVWQRAVYGGEPIPTPAVHVLCVDFGPALDRASLPAASAVTPS